MERASFCTTPLENQGCLVSSPVRDVPSCPKTHQQESEMDSLNYKYVFAFRQSPENNQCWRQRIAWFFRRLADRIDRRESYALRFVSDPVVSQNYRNRCVERSEERRVGKECRSQLAASQE